jgi:hypothetical protein
MVTSPDLSKISKSLNVSVVGPYEVPIKKNVFFLNENWA